MLIGQSCRLGTVGYCCDMACAIVPRHTGHDRLRFDLMSAGLRMWHTREQPEEFPGAHAHLVKFCFTELLPHLDRDERWLLDAQGCPEGRLLAEAMRAEIRTMTAAVYELAAATEACEAMALTRVLHTFLAAHDHHERLLHAAASTA